MNQNLIMIKTKEKRKLFTYKSNLNSIIEYAKTFRSELFEVETNINPLDLSELTKSLCDSNFDQNGNLKIIKKIYPKKSIKNSKSRSLILKEASIVKKWIEQQFKDKKVVCLKSLKEQFNEMELSDSALCNHLTAVRKKLTSQGQIITKTEKGEYCIIPEASYIRPL